jgi:hypothetical protein
MMQESLIMDASGNHHVVISDRMGWPMARLFLSQLATSGASYQYIRPTTARSASALRRVLAAQYMGVRVYVAGQAGLISAVRRATDDVGIGQMEQSIICLGPPAAYVFCMGCYHRFPHPGTDKAVCPKCGQRLEVTHHVSDRLEAVMGSLALPNPKGEGESQ